jgi:hypothetical protein
MLGSVAQSDASFGSGYTIRYFIASYKVIVIYIYILSGVVTPTRFIGYMFAIKTR